MRSIHDTIDPHHDRPRSDTALRSGCGGVLPVGTYGPTMRTVDAAGLPIGDGHPPRIMGVLNVSRESPYDPSVFDRPDEAASYVDEQLIDQGADIVDIGLESANKRFEVLSATDELERLDIAIETIDSVSGDAVFSIETRYAEVAEAALDRGFDMVNDICGFADPQMPVVCDDYDAAVVKMASPPDLERPGAVGDIDWTAERSSEWAKRATYVDELYEALLRGGLTEKTIVDPAFGGWSERKTLAHDRETFDRLREFRALDRPILVSINRKNFLREIADRSTEDALAVSLAATSMAVERGAAVVRTHDVAETRDAALIGYRFSTDRVESNHSDGGHSDSDRSDVSDSIEINVLDAPTIRAVERHADRLNVDPAIAREAVTYTLELRGLSEDERTVLSAAAADAGAVFAAGTDGCSRTDSCLLTGSVRALDRLLDSDRLLEDDLVAISQAIRRSVDRIDHVVSESR